MSIWKCARCGKTRKPTPEQAKAMNVGVVPLPSPKCCKQPMGAYVGAEERAR